MLARYSFRSQVVDRLEAIRSAILQPWGQPVDFLKRNSFDQAGPGLHFGLEAKTAYKWRPCQISQVVPGGAAWACGELMEGDEVVAVDGEKASQDTIMAALQGSKFSIGSESELTIMRGHAERKVVLSRSSELFTQTVSDAVETLGLLRQRIREVCDEKLSQDLSNLNAKLENQIRAHEMLRIRNEIALADKFSAAHLSGLMSNRMLRSACPDDGNSGGPDRCDRNDAVSMAGNSRRRSVRSYDDSARAYRGPGRDDRNARKGEDRAPGTSRDNEQEN